MDTPLEDKRALHEQRDRLEMAIVEEMLLKKTGHKDQLDSQHRQKRLLDKYMTSSKQLLDLYKSHDVERPQDHTNVTQACVDFYLNLRKLMERSAADDQEQLFLEPVIPDVVPRDLLEQESIENSLTVEATSSKAQAQVPIATEKLVEFTDEEGYGRYLDLNKCHEAYLQVIKREEVKPNYLDFLINFNKFHADLHRDRRLSSAYKNYAEQMLEYFRDYSRRAKPLFDYREMEDKADEKFQEKWATKSVPGWFTEVSESADQEVTEAMIELESYNSIEALMELGLDCLKKELQVRGLKCGGTLQERATRLWSIRGRLNSQLDASLFGASDGSKKKRKRKHATEPKYIASIESKLFAYADYYDEHRQATIENVQRKQARTADERNESDDDLSDVEDEETDQNDVIYNPKNLPLGWDGKPIPYWLYKLHGLNLTYNCEICGNATYKGPKTFQRHFAEQRHAHGMKCLGIPNTAHFANITKIQDAISLWDKLRDEKQKDRTQAHVEEEYEDSQGNVVNKKIYEDLKRQGLL